MVLLVAGLFVRFRFHLVVYLYFVLVLGDVAHPLLRRFWVINTDGSNLRLGDCGCWHGKGHVCPLLQLVRDLVMLTQGQVKDKQVVLVSTYNQERTGCA